MRVRHRGLMGADQGRGTKQSGHGEEFLHAAMLWPAGEKSSLDSARHSVSTEGNGPSSVAVLRRMKENEARSRDPPDRARDGRSGSDRTRHRRISHHACFDERAAGETPAVDSVVAPPLHRCGLSKRECRTAPGGRLCGAQMHGRRLSVSAASATAAWV